MTLTSSSPNEIGRPMNPSNLVRRHYRPLLERTALPVPRFHDLRHAAATLLLEANVNTKVVSEMLGHGQVGITMDLYQHVTPTMQQQAVDTFDGILTGP
jgi:integrase